MASASLGCDFLFELLLIVRYLVETRQVFEGQRATAQHRVGCLAPSSSFPAIPSSLLSDHVPIRDPPETIVRLPFAHYALSDLILYVFLQNFLLFSHYQTSIDPWICVTKSLNGIACSHPATLIRPHESLADTNRSARRQPLGPLPKTSFTYQTWCPRWKTSCAIHSSICWNGRVTSQAPLQSHSPLTTPALRALRIAIRARAMMRLRPVPLDLGGILLV